MDRLREKKERLQQLKVATLVLSWKKTHVKAANFPNRKEHSRQAIERLSSRQLSTCWQLQCLEALRQVQARRLLIQVR